MVQGGDMGKKLVEVLVALQEVGQDDAWPEGLAETAEDLASARIMSHPVSVSPSSLEVTRVASSVPGGEGRPPSLRETFLHRTGFALAVRAIPNDCRAA